MSDTQGNDDFAPRPFADVVRELAAGQTYDELTTLLGQVVEAVIRQRRPGSIKLTLKIMPNGENSVKIADKVDFTIPAAPRSESVFFAENGALVREDPRQAKMAFRTIDGGERKEPKVLPAAEAKEIKTA